LTASHQELPDDLATAHSLIRELAQTVHTQEHLIAKLQHQLEHVIRQRFGRKSEKVDRDQLLLFAHEIVTSLEEQRPAPVEPSPTVAESNSRTKIGHGRKPLPANLPRKQILHDLKPEQLPCPDFGRIRTKIGEEVREQLEYVPASVIVLQHVRPKYACKACQANVLIADRLPEPIEKSLPGPGLLAHVIVSKYADHLPLYRQEGIFRRFGVELSRQTTCDWMAACADLLAPISEAMLQRVLQSRVIQCDDTPVKVQDPKTGLMSTGRLWVYLGDWAHRFVVYDYTPDWSAEGPERILAHFRSGFLQADAYAGYNGIHARGMLEAGCMAHARRKFDEAKTTASELAHAGLAWIGRLYQVEREAKDQVADAIERLTQGSMDETKRSKAEQLLAEEITYRMRQEQSRPVVEKFREWLEAAAGRSLPKSPIGEAISYTRSNWVALSRYLDVGFLSIDNNAAERALRPVAVGRKNWLHVGNDKGGRTAAVLMTLIQSGRAFGVEPFAYLRDVLDRASTHPNSRIEELLPDHWKPVELPDPPGRAGLCVR
jgi:transposase